MTKSHEGLAGKRGATPQKRIDYDCVHHPANHPEPARSVISVSSVVLSGQFTMWRSLLLIRRNFGQLRREEAFLFFLVQRQTSRRNDSRGDEDDQILFG